MQRWPVRAWPLLLLLPGSAPLAAQNRDPLITDRPDFTESPVSVARGELQLEGGYTFARAQGMSNHSLGEVLLRVGAGGPLEFRIGLNSWVITGDPLRQHGFEDTSVGVKWELSESAGVVPAAGVILGTSLPTGGEAFGGDVAEPELVVALGWELLPRWTMGSNVGLSFGDPDSGEDNRWLASLTLGRELSDRVAVFGEAYGFSGGSGEATLFLDAGLTLAVSDDLQLDLRVARQIRGVDGEGHIGFGVARRWKVLP